MQKLNLPPFEYSLVKEGDKVLIFDIIRKKQVVVTPEEWVRQHFIHFLINHMKYPKSLIKVEGGLRYNTLSKRSDVVVFNREGMPWMLVECKSPDQKMDDAVVRQASMYNATLKARYIVVTNGLIHFCSEIDWLTNKFVLLPDIPPFG